MMKELSEFRSAKYNADTIFPGHEEITKRSYNIMAFKYFRSLKLIENKEEFFFKTYYSERGITYFTIDELLYFSITIIERRECYFGRFKINP